MKLQLLVPQYKETDKIVKPLLDSLAIQQNVNFNEIGVIIVNDGSDVKLSQNFLKSYPFKVEYYQNKHLGVSATRNECLKHATADYVMFCDADDMFFNACGLYIIFREIYMGGFEALTSVFVEETKDPFTKEIVYINREMDSTFVHGKVYNRKFLLKNNISFNPKLTIHEDSYFNCLAQKCATEVKYSPSPFYLWKWRDDSVCRHDPKYILKTYNNMLDSNTELVKELIKRGKKDDAQFYVVSMVYDAYFTMNKDEWINQKNKQYRFNTEKRFKKYYLDFKNLYETINPMMKTQIIMGIKNRMFQEGLVLESITFDDWIKHVEKDF